MSDLVRALRDYQRWMTDNNGEPSISIDDINGDETFGAAAAVIGASVARIEALEAAQTWQPIEIAPKDGSMIIVAQKNHLKEKFNWASSAYWYDNEPCPCRPPKCKPGTHTGWMAGLDKLSSPTHWMPLPEPPKGASSDEAAEGDE